MKKYVLLCLSLFAAVPAFGQESGNRIYGNTGYRQQKRQANSGMLGNSNEGYAIEARVLTNLKPDAYVVVFEAAAKVLKSKEQKYASALGVSPSVVGLSIEQYNVTYPAEAYQRYQAFETGDASVHNPQGVSSRVVQRKSFTLFYEPFEGSSFETVLVPLGLEPMVQFSIYLRMQYKVRRSSLNLAEFQEARVVNQSTLMPRRSAHLNSDRPRMQATTRLK